MRSKIIQQDRYDALNGLRTLACIGIVAMHVRANVPEKPTENFFTTNILGIAQDFVSMFFMVSAFALCCGYLKRIQNMNISLNKFYNKRYIRILPFFALLTLIDVFITIFSENFTFTETIRATLYEAFANMSLLFGLIPGANISVIGVGWFIGVIFLFYLLFPFFTCLLTSKKKAWNAFIISVGLYFSVKLYFNPIKGVVFDNSSFIHAAPFFIMGGIIYLYKETITSNKLTLSFSRYYTLDIVYIVILITTIGYTAFFFLFPNLRFTLSNLILYALWIIYAVRESLHHKTTLLNNKLMTFMSSISMEIYLCHMMFYRIIEKSQLLSKYITNNDAYFYLTFILTLIGAIIFSNSWKRWIEPSILKIIEK